jgi:hypothetical protein
MRLLICCIYAIFLSGCAAEEKKVSCSGDLCLSSPPTNQPITCETLPGQPFVRFPDNVSRDATVIWCSSGCVTYVDVLDASNSFANCK